LQHICQVESISHELPALERLAKAADGSMRDALSLLDQAIAYGQGQVTIADVNVMLGSMAQEDLLPLLNALAAQDGPQLFAEIKLLAERSPDFEQALEALISLLHSIAITQVVPGLAQEDAIKQLANRFSPEDIQVYYQIALLGRRDLAYSPSPQQGFEMTLLRLLAFKPVVATHIATPVVSTPAKPIATQTITAAASTVAVATATETAPVTAVNIDWREILPKLGLAGMALALASNCMLKNRDGNKIELIVSASHQPMLNAKLKERIAESLSAYFKQPIQLEINTTSENIVTPTQQHQQAQNERLHQAKQTVMQNPQIKSLIERYDATVEVSLLG
jgi:DNA polymerase III subunit gamma/tau